MHLNITRNRHLTFLGLASVGVLSMAPRIANAQTTVNCGTVLSAIQNAVDVSGTIVGKSTSTYSMVQVAAARGFNPNTWNPASTGAPQFSLASHSSHLRGQFQTIQTFSSAAGNPGWSGEEDLWIFRSGAVFSRSITWGSGWSLWQNVRCFRAPRAGFHYGTSNPLQRVIIQGWNPYNGSFVTLDLVERVDLI